MATVSTVEGATSSSIGEEPNRRVVISSTNPVKKYNNYKGKKKPYNKGGYRPNAADHRAKDAAMQKVRKRNLMFSAIRKMAKIADVLQDRITSLESANSRKETNQTQLQGPMFHAAHHRVKQRTNRYMQRLIWNKD